MSGFQFLFALSILPYYAMRRRHRDIYISMVADVLFACILHAKRKRDLS